MCRYRGGIHSFSPSGAVSGFDPEHQSVGHRYREEEDEEGEEEERQYVLSKPHEAMAGWCFIISI
jgi:hypothetical protein